MSNECYIRDFDLSVLWLGSTDSPISLSWKRQAVEADGEVMRADSENHTHTHTLRQNTHTHLQQLRNPVPYVEPDIHLRRNVTTLHGDADHNYCDWSTRPMFEGVLINQSLRYVFLTTVYFTGKLSTLRVVSLLT